MHEFILGNEAALRLGFFLGIFAIMAGWEGLAPRRALSLTRLWRWSNNLGLVALNTLMLRLVFPVLAVGLALWARENGWGLFNNVEAPFWLAFAVALVVQDLVIYGQHVMVHYVPVLWRLHRVHHADPDFDVTTALRFHTLEIALSMAIKMGTVLALGPPLVAVIVFEIVLNGMAMFNHGNVRLPGALDRVLRALVVTPDMHRVHHSIIRRETDSNFGFNLSIWDRLFGTYRAQPEKGHGGMEFGVETFRDERRQSLWWMLALPFRGR